MAFSQSIRKAQTPKFCDLCEKDININWKCIQCNTLMCNTCKKIHLKVQTSVQHEIVNIKYPGDVGRQRAIRTDNIPCQIHDQKLHCMFCRNCDTLVCPECISKSHRQHELESIDQVCPEMKERLGVSNYQIEKTLAFCNFQTESLHRAEATSDSVYANALEKIDKREQELKDEITKYAGELRKRIGKEKKQTKITLIDIGKRTKITESKLRDKQNKIQTTNESDQAGMIFSAASRLTEDIQNLSIEKLPKNILDFCSGEQSRQNVVTLFGLLKPTEIPHHVDLATQKSYTTDLPSVDILLLRSNDKLWISSTPAEVMRLVEKDNKMKTVKEMCTKAVDITFTSRNDILLTLVDSSDVMQVTTTGELKPFLSVSPLLGKGIHVTRDDDVIVGVREKGDPYKVTKISYRKIIIFGSDRQEKCSYEYDQNNKRLFTVPYEITTNVNNDIVVIDMTSSITGRVVVLGKEGDLRWVYGGYPAINTGESPFDPWDVVTSPVGHIIVADSNNHALHVISGVGDVLMCKVMNDQGIIFPISLDIDFRGQLWVGCSTCKGKKDDAKIHVLKLY